MKVNVTRCIYYPDSGWRSYPSNLRYTASCVGGYHVERKRYWLEPNEWHIYANLCDAKEKILENIKKKGYYIL